MPADHAAASLALDGTFPADRVMDVFQDGYRVRLPLVR
jgi:hypothetical protein